MRIFPFLFFLLFSPMFAQLNAQSISENGYPEHFVAGALIGGTVSYLTYKKTNNKFKSWTIGFLTASGIGLLKEVIDPAINRKRNIKDFNYTALGGMVGASIVIPLGRRKQQAESPPVSP